MGVQTGEPASKLVPKQRDRGEGNSEELSQLPLPRTLEEACPVIVYKGTFAFSKWQNCWTSASWASSATNWKKMMLPPPQWWELKIQCETSKPKNYTWQVLNDQLALLSLAPLYEVWRTPEQILSSAASPPSSWFRCMNNEENGLWVPCVPPVCLTNGPEEGPPKGKARYADVPDQSGPFSPPKTGCTFWAVQGTLWNTVGESDFMSLQFLLLYPLISSLIKVVGLIFLDKKSSLLIYPSSTITTWKDPKFDLRKNKYHQL